MHSYEIRAKLRKWCEKEKYRIFTYFWTFYFFSFSHFSTKTCSEFSVLLIQNCSPNSALSNGAIKSIKVAHIQCSVLAQSYPSQKYGKSFVLKESQILSTVGVCLIRVFLIFLVEAFSNLPVYSYSTFIACVTSCLCSISTKRVIQLTSVQSTTRRWAVKKFQCVSVIKWLWICYP